MYVYKNNVYLYKLKKIIIEFEIGLDHDWITKHK